MTVSSISAYTASVNRGDYCMAKAALSMITPLYAARLAEHGINVYEIRPGIIATDMTGPVKEKYDQLIAGGLTPIKRWGFPEDVGKAVSAPSRKGCCRSAPAKSSTWTGDFTCGRCEMFRGRSWQSKSTPTLSPKNLAPKIERLFELSAEKILQHSRRPGTRQRGHRCSR